MYTTPRKGSRSPGPPIPGLLARRSACPALRPSQRRTISAVALVGNGTTATTLIARPAASLAGWRSQPGELPVDCQVL